MTQCATCRAQFGIKFEKHICSRCQQGHCGGHLVLYESVRVHHSLTRDFAGGGSGLCIGCIMTLWGKDDESLKPPQGIAGRLKHAATGVWETVTKPLPRGPRGVELVVMHDDDFESFNRRRALAVLRNQSEITYEVMVRDLTLFARLYAISQGRSSERAVCLSDVFSLMDWLRSHPMIPDWAHGITWSSLESSPTYFAYLTDVFRVVRSALDPVGSAYHVADRLLEQTTGKTIFQVTYETVKDKLGINVNVKQAFMYYLAGLFVMQLLKRKEAVPQRLVPAN